MWEDGDEMPANGSTLYRKYLRECVKNAEKANFENYRQFLTEVKKERDEQQKMANEVARIEREVLGRTDEEDCYIRDRYDEHSMRFNVKDISPEHAKKYSEELMDIANKLDDFLREFTADDSISLLGLKNILNSWSDNSFNMRMSAVLLRDIGEGNEAGSDE